MPPQLTNNTNRKILVVDDSRELCENIKDILESHGFSVTCAFDGLQAIQKVAEEQPATVLMDVQMPLMDGLTALEKIKQLFPSTSVWMMTGYLAFDLTDDAIRVGAAGLLSKPLDVVRMLRLISA
jgi:two-component system response regulator YesN